MDEGLLRVHPKTTIGKAVVCLNNPFVIGRKKQMFGKSLAGDKVNASGLKLNEKGQDDTFKRLYYLQ